MSEIQKEHPNNQMKYGDSKKQPEVGDTVRLSDGTVCVVIEMSPDKTVYKGAVLKEKNNGFELEGSKTVTFGRDKIASTRENEDLRLKIETVQHSVHERTTLTSELRDSLETYTMSKTLYAEKSIESRENESHHKRKENKHTHNMSVSVITNGDIDGYIKGGNSHETIISGETADGVLFTAHSIGENIWRKG